MRLPFVCGIMMGEAFAEKMVFCFIGPTEVAIILIIALLVFGPQKLPEVGKQIGAVWREMNRMRNDVERMLDMDDYNSRYDRTPYYTPNETIYPQISGPLEEPEKRIPNEYGDDPAKNAPDDAHAISGRLDADATEEHTGVAHARVLQDASVSHSEINGAPTLSAEPETTAPTKNGQEDLDASRRGAQEHKNHV